MAERVEERLEHWFWDAQLQVWREHPRDRLAATAVEMGCDNHYSYEREAP